MLNNYITKESKYEYIIIAIDSTGIKITNTKFSWLETNGILGKGIWRFMLHQLTLKEQENSFVEYSWWACS